MPSRLDVPDEREDGRLRQCYGMTPEQSPGKRACHVTMKLCGMLSGGESDTRERKATDAHPTSSFANLSTQRGERDEQRTGGT